MSKLTRDLQLSWFESDSVIKQDQELIDTIARHKYVQALGYGDVSYFKKYINIVESGPENFCVYIVNELFDFDNLVNHLNQIISTQLNSNSLVYLSLNKYLAIPRCYDPGLSINYDRAIEEFISKNVNGIIEEYFACGNDNGNKFNWAHPLTRFYLRVNT